MAQPPFHVRSCPNAPEETQEAFEADPDLTTTVARVKRIIKLDEEIGACNSGTAFLVTVAAVRNPPFSQFPHHRTKATPYEY